MHSRPGYNTGIKCRKIPKASTPLHSPHQTVPSAHTNLHAQMHMLLNKMHSSFCISWHAELLCCLPRHTRLQLSPEALVGMFGADTVFHADESAYTTDIITLIRHMHTVPHAEAPKPDFHWQARHHANTLGLKANPLILVIDKAS